MLEGAARRIEAALQLERREARLEARVLAARALEVAPAWLLGHDRDELRPAQAAALETLVARREAGEPVAYILEEREFHGHLFRVTRDVLIPRPDTERLVEAALERGPTQGPTRALDLGTGSGCIAISLALARPDWDVWAVERSPAALVVARDNARRLGARVRFQEGDWFAGLEGQAFDLIVSNPPYVAAADSHLLQGDLRHEPRSALASGPEGLDDLSRLIEGAADHLTEEGWLMLEHGCHQGDACRVLLNQQNFRKVSTLADLAGLPRVSLGCRPFKGCRESLQHTRIHT